ncbi:MAG: hypothetical protein J7L89_04395 [Bacteroidales bacterium]|nr:hypothetical protein [Bacteroidales bacterium]
MKRRKFIKSSAIGAALTMVPGIPVFAGPFDQNDYQKYVPLDKKLDPQWVASLFARGVKETYHDPKALDHIGMPVGGLFSGTVYLSGDGRLWLWNIFNRDQEGIEPREIEFHGQKVSTRSGANFIDPAKPYFPFRQGFELNVNDRVFSIDQKGFNDITFDGRYPMGKISYRDKNCPVAIDLEAFTPFIPLNVEDSSLPATCMFYRLHNPTDRQIELILSGFTENPVCIDSGATHNGTRINRVIRTKKLAAIECLAVAPPQAKPLNDLRDFGTFTLTLLDPGACHLTATEEGLPVDEAMIGNLAGSLTGRISKKITLQPGESREVRFLFTWHFPNFYGRDFKGVRVGHSYGARFKSARAVAQYIAGHQKQLIDKTRKWVQTWYDSTLPYWLLDRTMANTSTLATTTCYRFEDGRFWAWEGIGCCTGTCTHVWHYAQAVGRLFPEIERDQRERVDFGMALHEDGVIGYRALLDSSMGPAFDGQCGRILGVYREHQMSTDDRFLKRIWPQVKKAMDYMIRKDANDDGVIEGAQPNTLDAAWYGKISFITSLYLAALEAGYRMASEMNDIEFMKRCRRIADEGKENILQMFNGEYFYQIEDTAHADVIGVGKGCYIDQVFGQTWAHWVGMGTIFDREKQLAALRSLWKYNFVPDVGPFREHFKRGRWYALAGDGGLIMSSWPKGGKSAQWEKQWQFMYFNECMSGFEWQAAAHMVYEGLDQPDILQNGLAVSRAIHDRYSAHRRNPYNEIECSDHYARAMASYGVFQAVCGYYFHGPKGVIELIPRLIPEDFKAPFVAAAGWGTFTQKRTSGSQIQTFTIHYGQLRLQQIRMQIPEGKIPKEVSLQLDGKHRAIKEWAIRDQRLIVSFKEIAIHEGSELKISVKI